MVYKLVITKSAEELLDRCVYHIAIQLKNEQVLKYGVITYAYMNLKK